MQRIEKYGVIALVFLLVTILAVSLWSQKKGKSPFAWFKHTDAPITDTTAQAPTETPLPNNGQPINNPIDQNPIAPTNPNGAPNPNGPAIDQHGPTTAFTPQPNIGGATGGLGQSLTPQNPTQGGPNTLHTDNFVAGGTSIGNPKMPKPEVNQVPPKRTLETDKVATRSYTVKSGETLGKIAAHELGSFSKWTEIAKLNHNLDPKKVHAGMKLELPAVAKSATHESGREVTREAGHAKPNAGKETVRATESLASYTVKKGDTLSSIAAKTLGNGSRWVEIEKLNPEIHADRLAVGAKLHLPEAAATKNSDVETVASVTPKNHVR